MSTAALAASCRLSENATALGLLPACLSISRTSVASSCDVLAKPVRKLRIGD